MDCLSRQIANGRVARIRCVLGGRQVPAVSVLLVFAGQIAHWAKASSAARAVGYCAANIAAGASEAGTISWQLGCGVAGVAAANSGEQCGGRGAWAGAGQTRCEAGAVARS